jgi:hypothetical protein
MSIDQLPPTEKAPDWGDNVPDDYDWSQPVEGSHDDIMNKLHETPAVKKGLARRAVDKFMGRAPKEISLQPEKDAMFTAEAMNPNNPAAVGAKLLEGPTWDEAKADNKAWDARVHEEGTARDLRVARDELFQLYAQQKETTGDQAKRRIMQQIAEKEADLSRLQKAQKDAERGVTTARSAAHVASTHRETMEATQLYIKNHGQR